MRRTSKRAVAIVATLVAVVVTAGCIPVNYEYTFNPVRGTNENYGLSAATTYTYAPPDGSPGLLYLNVPCFGSGEIMAGAIGPGLTSILGGTEQVTCRGGVSTGWVAVGGLNTGDSFQLYIEDIRSGEYAPGTVYVQAEVRSLTDGSVYQKF